jgi:predicted Zn-dependent peptidase
LYRKTTLDNGLRVLVSTMPHTYSVCVAIFIGVGSRYESESEAGTSHFIEHICFRGTPRYPTARDISEAIEGVGGILNGATDKELTFFWCKVTKPHFPAATRVLVDMLRNSKFNPEDIEKERQVIIEEINMCKDSPSQQVGLLIDGLLWPGHPLGRDIAGTRESMAGINRKTLKDFLHSRYSPDNCLVTVTGDVTQDEVLEVVRKLLGDWHNPGDHSPYLPYVELPGEQLKIEKRDTEQAHVCLSLPGVSLFHPQRFPLDILNVILGEGMSSRLFSEIRDKLGLAYSISSYVEHYLDTGALTVSASVDPDNLHQAIRAVLEQLAQLKEGIPETELDKAREISKGRLLLRMEDSRNVAGWLAGQEMLMNHILTLDEVIHIIDSITVDQLKEVARSILVGEKLKLAVVGPIQDADAVRKLLVL